MTTASPTSKPKLSIPDYLNLVKGNFRILLNDMALGYLSVGGRCWIIDVGRSYEKLCHTVGGQFIEFTPDANICMNPFSMIKDTDDFDDQMGMLRDLLAQMISPSQPLGDYEKSQIEIHLRSVYYEKGNSMTMDDLAYSLINNCEKGGPNPQAVDDEYRQMVRNMSPEERDKICDPAIRRLGVQLFPYTSDGSYGRYFNGPATIEFKSNFIVLELEELASKPDLQTVVMFLLMYKITDAMYLTRDKPKICIIDEAWSLLNGGRSATFIETGYRRARKYKGSFITGTQSIGDYSKSPAAEAVAKIAQVSKEIEAAVDGLAADCGCTLLVTGAVISSDIPDYTQALKERMGMGGVNLEALRKQAAIALTPSNAFLPQSN